MLRYADRPDRSTRNVSTSVGYRTRANRTAVRMTSSFRMVRREGSGDVAGEGETRYTLLEREHGRNGAVDQVAR